MSAPRRRLSEAEINYRPRIVGLFLVALMLLSVADDRLVLRGSLAGLCLCWPHLAYWVARKRGGDKRAEGANVLLDFALGGVLFIGFSFRLWPAVALFVIGFINALLFGGPRFLLLALGVTIAAGFASALALGIKVHLETEPVAVVISVITIV